jgi:microcystin-dependent protein
MKLKLTLAAMAAAIATSLSATPAAIAQEPFLGEVRLFGYNFCPRGWLEAEGQLLPISQYSALFSLYGTMYGGDGRSSFGLPDLRGRVPMGQGNGPGLPVAQLGQRDTGRPVTADSASSTRTTPTLTMRYCVALQGTYPSRS